MWVGDYGKIYRCWIGDNGCGKWFVLRKGRLVDLEELPEEKLEPDTI